VLSGLELNLKGVLHVSICFVCFKLFGLLYFILNVLISFPWVLNCSACFELF